MTSTHRPRCQSTPGIWILSLDRLSEHRTKPQVSRTAWDVAVHEQSDRAEQRGCPWLLPPWHWNCMYRKHLWASSDGIWRLSLDWQLRKHCHQSLLFILKVASPWGQACHHVSQPEGFLSPVFLVAHLFPLISTMTNLQKINLRICMVCYCLFISCWYTHIYTYMPISTTERNFPTSNIKHGVCKRCTGCNGKPSQRTQ